VRRAQGRPRADARDEEPADGLLVFTETLKGAQRIVGLSPEAIRARLSAGMTLADARAVHPGLEAMAHDAGADARLLQRVADDAERFSPVVMIDPPDGLTLDITGCAHLFGGEGGLRAAMGARLKRLGFSARITIAGTPDAARALARHGRVGVAAPREDGEAVRPLGVAALGLDEETRLALARAGLKTIGDLMDRPSLPLAARFGEATARGVRRLAGMERSPLTPRRPEPDCMAERRFPEPVARTEDIEATLDALLEEVCETLQQRRAGGRLFEALFFRADGAVRRICVETGKGAREARIVMRLFRERLETLDDPLDPGFGFDLVRLTVASSEPLGREQTSLDGRRGEDDEVSGLVDRLSTRFGRERILRFEARDTHDPKRAARLRPAVDDGPADDIPGGSWPAPATGEPPLRPLQMFDPPQPVDVKAAAVPDGAPKAFTWRRAEHEIVLAEGPERISPEWWRNPSGALTRDYFRVEDEEGRRFWLFREGLYGRETDAPRWFIQGVFA
jgi:protein ImuB